MNKQRRQKLLDAIELLERARGMVEEAKEEEQEYYDNMPEVFQSGERGDDAETAIDGLQSAEDGIQEAIDQIEEAKG